MYVEQQLQQGDRQAQRRRRHPPPRPSRTCSPSCPGREQYPCLRGVMHVLAAPGVFAEGSNSDYRRITVSSLLVDQGSGRGSLAPATFLFLAPPFVTLMSMAPLFVTSMGNEWAITVHRCQWERWARHTSDLPRRLSISIRGK
nr:unnamed protein product [Digitaria exilis]